VIEIPGLLDHLLFLVLLVLVPLSGRNPWGIRRLVRAGDADLPAARRAFYRGSLVLLWVLAAALIVLWLVTRRPWDQLGLVLRLNGGLAGVIAGLAAMVAVLARRQRVAPDDREALAKLEKDAGQLARLLPASGGEFGWFAAVSVSAGICEEALYRGFLIWYLGAWAAMLVPGPHVFVAAAAGSALVFGLGHSYQGWRNTLVTALTGGFLAAVYWITGSLYAAMLIHALMDLQAGYTSYAAHAAARVTEA